MATGDHKALISRLKFHDRLFAIVGLVCTLIGLLTAVVLLTALVWKGSGALSFHFLTSFPSRKPAEAGILSAWVGSLLVIVVTISTAVPVGVAAAVYLEEYARKNWLTNLIEINISNLAGVPSIIYGLTALGILVNYLHLGRSILVAGLTLGFLILPIVIVATREALRTVPQSIREASYAMGATKWQVIRLHLLPYSAGGIATGIIIAVSRALGEAAPVVAIGAMAYVAYLPKSPFQATAPFLNVQWLSSSFTVLPIQMFNWVSRPGPAFQVNAAATGLVLIILTFTLNAAAMYVRYHMRKRIKW